MTFYWRKRWTLCYLFIFWAQLEACGRGHLVKSLYITICIKHIVALGNWIMNFSNVRHFATTINHLKSWITYCKIEPVRRRSRNREFQSDSGLWANITARGTVSGGKGGGQNSGVGQDQIAALDSGLNFHSSSVILERARVTSYVCKFRQPTLVPLAHWRAMVVVQDLLPSGRETFHRWRSVVPGDVCPRGSCATILVHIHANTRPLCVTKWHVYVYYIYKRHRRATDHTSHEQMVYRSCILMARHNARAFDSHAL